MKVIISLVLLFMLAGCNSSAIKPLENSYDFQVIDSYSQEKITLNQLANKLQNFDVIFLGEFHGNHASHLLQAQLQAALFAQNSNQVLTMEQFTTDKQAVLNAYLEDEIGEKILIKKAKAWHNYTASYRPLVEFAKRNFLPVYAANAPADLVRCVGRKGAIYLDKFKNDKSLPKQPFLNDKGYEKKFMGLMKKTHKVSKSPKNSYLAQLLRDNSMAETIIKARSEHPNAQVIHTNGAFHSNQFLGTAALVKKRQPAIKIAVISPIHVKEIKQPRYQLQDLKEGNFIYLVTAQPNNYKQAKNRMKAFKKMFKDANKKVCK